MEKNFAGNSEVNKKGLKIDLSSWIFLDTNNDIGSPFKNKQNKSTVCSPAKIIPMFSIVLGIPIF